MKENINVREVIETELTGYKMEEQEFRPFQSRNKVYIKFNEDLEMYTLDPECERYIPSKAFELISKTQMRINERPNIWPRECINPSVFLQIFIYALFIIILIGVLLIAMYLVVFSILNPIIFGFTAYIFFKVVNKLVDVMDGVFAWNEVRAFNSFIKGENKLYISSRMEVKGGMDGDYIEIDLGMARKTVDSYLAHMDSNVEDNLLTYSTHI